MFSGKHILYTTEVCCILTGIVVFVAAFFAMNKGYVEVSKVSTILDMIFRKEGKARLEINTHMEAFSTMIFSAIKYLENSRHSPSIIYLYLCTQLFVGDTRSYYHNCYHYKINGKTHLNMGRSSKDYVWSIITKKKLACVVRTRRYTLQFTSLQFRWHTNLMYFRNFDRHSLRFLNCEAFGRVLVWRTRRILQHSILLYSPFLSFIS